MLMVSLQASMPEEHYVGFELLTTTFFSTHWKLQVFYPHITTYGTIYCCWITKGKPVKEASYMYVKTPTFLKG